MGLLIFMVLTTGIAVGVAVSYSLGIFVRITGSERKQLRQYRENLRIAETAERKGISFD